MSLAALIPLALLAFAAPDAAAQDATTAEVRLNDLPVGFQMPTTDGKPPFEWVRGESPEPVLLLNRADQPLPGFAVYAWGAFQPDLTDADPATAVLDAVLEEAPPEFMEGTLTLTHAVHDKVGPMLRGTATVLPKGAPRELELQLALFAVEGRGAAIAGYSLAETGDLTATMDELLSTAVLLKAPVGSDARGGGTVQVAAGYSLPLPDGWRPLTETEMKPLTGAKLEGGPYDGVKANQIFVDPRDISGQSTFACMADSSADHPTEVLPPARAPVLAKNFRTRSLALITGTSITSASGEKVPRSRVDLWGGPAVRVEEPGDAPVELISLGDRDGWTWETQGELRGQKVQIRTFYTAWDNVALECFAIAYDTAPGVLPAFETAMAGLRVTDGEAHPMWMPLTSKYKRWWPYDHPALQLYWAPIPLILLGLWLALRD